MSHNWKILLLIILQMKKLRYRDVNIPGRLMYGRARICTVAVWFRAYIIATAQYCSSQTDQSPFCLCIEATDVLICHLGPVAGKRNHSSILVCLQNHWKGCELAFRNYFSTRLPIRPSREVLRRPPPATSEFQMTLLAAVYGSGNCYSETALNTHQLETASPPNLSLGQLWGPWDAGTLQKTQCFHKCVKQINRPEEQKDGLLPFLPSKSQ